MRGRPRQRKQTWRLLRTRDMRIEFPRITEGCQEIRVSHRRDRHLRPRQRQAQRPILRKRSGSLYRVNARGRAAYRGQRVAVTDTQGTPKNARPPVRTWREEATRHRFKVGTVHAIDTDDEHQSLCKKILVSEEPYHGLSPGEYCFDPVTCKACIRANEQIQIGKLAEKYKFVANLDVRAAARGVRWASSLHARGIPWAPWNASKADPIALRKVSDLCQDDHTRVRLAGICMKAAMQYWQTLKPGTAARNDSGT